MDSEDETIHYFKLLNDSSGNYLVQNNYELQDCLPEEPIFTEIETGTWPSEALSILLNNSSVNENTNVKGKDDNKIEKEQGPNVLRATSNFIKFYCPLPSESMDIISHEGKNKIPSSQTQGVKLSQFHSTQGETITINITHESQPETRKKTLPTNGNNNESTYFNDRLVESQCLKENKHLEKRSENKFQIVGINESSYIGNEEYEDDFSSTDSPNDEMSREHSILNELHSIITARKCKVCSFLCESPEEINCHLKDVHSDLIKLKLKSELTNNDNNSKKKMRSLLDNNLSILGNKTIFVCSACKQSFATEKLLICHLKTHGEENNESDENKLISSTPNETPKNDMRKLAVSLLKNQRRWMKTLKCSENECDLKFPDDESKLRHQKCHVPNGKHFQCSECAESFSVWRLCCKHLWTRHKINAGLYIRPPSNNSKLNSTVSEPIMNYTDVHRQEEPFVCTECGKSFELLDEYRKHKIIHVQKLRSPSLHLKCTICDRFFANKKSLKNHKDTVHDKIKPFICTLCGHKTSRKSMLELHYRRHTGEKPHHCPHCSYQTSDSNCLRRHVMKHLSCMQYSCPYCEYQAIQSTAYKNHLKTKHPGAEEIFKCGYCTFTTLKSDLYLTHIKCHEHDQKMKGKKDDNLVAVTIGEVECDDAETPTHLHEQDDYDNSEDFEDDENID